MARGHIGGRQRLQIDPSAFLQGGGGGDNKGDIEMAMALMGYGKGSSPQDQALEAQKQAWAEKYQAGQLSLAELTQKAAEANYKSEAEARTAAITDTAEQRKVAAQNELQRQKEVAEARAIAEAKSKQDIAKDVLKEMLPYLPKDKAGAIIESPEYARLAELATPGRRGELEQSKANLRNQQIQEGVVKYQAADEKTKKQLAANPATLGPPDVVGEILKQAGVQTPTAPEARPIGGAVGAIGNWAWNAPGALQNVGKGTVNLLAKGALGSEAPQVPYTEFTSPTLTPMINARDYSKFPGSVEDLIAASRRSVEAAPPPEILASEAPGIGAPIPQETGFLDQLLQKIRGRGGPGSPIPPMPPQGVFQPFPG